MKCVGVACGIKSNLELLSLHSYEAAGLVAKNVMSQKLLQSALTLLLYVCHFAAPSPVCRLGLFSVCFCLLCDSDWQADVVGASGRVKDALTAWPDCVCLRPLGCQMSGRVSKLCKICLFCSSITLTGKPSSPQWRGALLHPFLTLKKKINSKIKLCGYYL